MKTEKLKNIFDACIKFTGDKYSAFNSSSRYFKMRAGVIAGWLLLSLLSLGLSFTGKEHNPINATVDMTVFNNEIFIHVQNNSTKVWTGIKLGIPGGWHYSHESMLPGESISININRFISDEEGRDNHPVNMPSELYVSTDLGDYHYIRD